MAGDTLIALAVVGAGWAVAYALGYLRGRRSRRRAERCRESAPATARQLEYIAALCERAGVDDLAAPSLTVEEASDLIDDLRSGRVFTPG